MYVYSCDMYINKYYAIIWKYLLSINPVILAINARSSFALIWIYLILLSHIKFN